VIVRILGEGQFQVAEDVAAKLTALDTELDAAVRKSDDAAFHAALGAAVGLVRESGTSVPADTFVTADFILPFSDASIDEVRKLLADGTITGSDSIGLP
jgi:PspAA-like protein